MAANVLKSRRAIEMSIFVVRAFVRLQETLAANHQVADKLNALEGKLQTHDAAIEAINTAIRRLMEPLPKSARRIGFQARPADKLKSMKAGSGN